MNTRLAGNSRPLAAPSLVMPSKSPSLAIALPVGSTTTISSAWFAATQMLSSLSMMSPSAPLMLLTKTTGVPGVPPVTGILMIWSLPVLATNSAFPALLNWRPLAPNGGTPLVASNGCVTQAVATCGQVEPVAFQMMPWKESEMYVLPAPSKVRAFNPAAPGGVGTVMHTDD